LKDDALLMGFALSQAQRWRSRRAGDIPERDLGFIERSSRTAAKRVLRVQALVGLLGAIILTGVFVWWRQPWLEKQLYWLTDVRGHALSAQAEFALEPLRSFTECTDCPELVVLPPGEYMMGSSPREVGHVSDEEPEHTVKIVKPFAVSKYDVTNDEWDLCVKQGGCTQSGYTAFGRGRRPVTNISWNEARQYVVWLEGLTGRPYRLLSEAEWEYAARAGTATRFFFGDDDAVAGTYVVYYLNSGHETKPVGTKHPNAFGLFDMYGNVWQWCEDPSHPNYRGAPVDGSAWQDSDTSLRILRGGSWYDNTDRLRSAGRNREPPSLRAYNIGFRVARTLATRGP
jgi:formylglycine-generating enzyme required for sulfatase activity